MFSNLILDDVLKLIQIIFYTVGTVVAILTYRSAKRGLLNTVNTEYQKRVMDRIKEVSDELASEFDPDSTNFWPRAYSTAEAVKHINETFARHKQEILKTGEYDFGIPVGKDVSRLERIVQNIKTDPFLPRSIRNIVVNYLEKRTSALANAQMAVLEEYIEELIKGKHAKEVDSDSMRVRNKIVDKLNQSGYGVRQVETEIDKMRLAMQDYFNSYDPLPDKKRK